MKTKEILMVSGIFLILFAVVLGLYLAVDVLLYSGIMQSVNNWGINNSMVVWGIIRALFFEIGAIPSVLIGAIGGILMKINI